METPTFLEAMRTLGVAPSALEDVLSDVSFGVFVDHVELGCIYASAEVLRMFELTWEQFEGFGWAQSVLPADMETLREAIERYEIEKSTIEVRYRIQRPSGELRALHVVGHAVLDADGEQLGSVMIGRDETAERAIRDRSVQGQKLEAIGRLASRVAHDFNNVLTPIVCGAYLLEAEALSPEGRENLAIILDGVQHAAGITHQLLGLSRQEVLTPRTSSLDQEILQLRPLLAQLLGEEVRLELHLDTRNTMVGLASHEIGQVLLNLCVNSRDAMAGSGRLAVYTRQVGAFCELTVEDDGPGVPVDVQQHMFEPFFTTKAQDRGTGLGLSTVRELAQRAGGEVRVFSELGERTRMTVALPSLASAPIELGHSLPPVEVPPMRVLLVDDNAALRQTLAYVLALRKHSVKSAGSIARGLELLRTESFDLLVADVLLPDGQGDQLANIGRTLHPGLMTIYISGYAGTEFRESAVAFPRTAFLHKPFHPNRLAATLAELWAESEVLGVG